MSLPDYFNPFSDIIVENEPLSNHTYMKVGGVADYFALIRDQEQLVQLLTCARENHHRFMIIGGGSNTIFSDEGYRGLIIGNQTQSVQCDQTGKCVVASGVILNAFINHTIDQGLGGLAGFMGTPGTIGGAVYNNSHFGKQLIADFITRIEVLTEQNTRTWISKNECDFKYDYSNFQQNKMVILSVEFQLEPNSDKNALRQQANESVKKRHESQPLQLPNSGCMFKNPEGTSAGALIDKAGLKGLRKGDAEVSSLHANFIVNDNQAKVSDIIDLSNEITAVVKQKFDISLQREVFILDQFGERIDA
jgi:UDP-N-acetylmuramate dehydrogenase